MTSCAPPGPRSIGIVLHDLPLGGTERIALRLAAAWADRGIAVTIFLGAEEGPLRPLVPSAIRLVAADPPIRRGRGSRARLGRAAARYFAAQPVDAVFVPGNFHWEVVPSLARIPQGPAVVVQVSSPLRMPQRGWLRQCLFERRMRRLLGSADALVAMAEPHRAQIAAILPAMPVTVLPLPALGDDARTVPAPSARTILSAGRLIHQKGFDLLIEAFRRLDDPAARLVIVGSGPEQAALARQIAATGLGDRIRLAGYQPDIRPFLDEARLFVMASRFEGYGAVIVEALGAGRPVVATDSTPAIDDVMTDERGIVVPVEDAAALTDAIRALLDRPPPDPDRLADAVARFRLGVGARAYHESFAEAIARRKNP